MLVVLPLDVIQLDHGTQVRAQIDDAVVALYAEAKRGGAVFPPVDVIEDADGVKRLGDGFHRFKAHERLQWVTIEAEVRPGTRAEAIWFAIGANNAHGLQKNDADKRRGVEIAIAECPDKTQREIAEQVGCSQQFVSQVASTATSKVPHHYAKLPADKADAIAAAIRAGQPDREIARTLKASTHTVRRVRIAQGLPVLTVDKQQARSADRRQVMQQMATAGYTSRQISDAVGLTFESTRNALRTNNIDVPADRAVGKTKRLDTNRITHTIVMDAANVTAGAELIDFAALDRSKIPEWLQSLKASREKLGELIRRLMKEQQNGAEGTYPQAV